MLKRISLFFVIVSCSALSAGAADAPPSEASIKNLLEITQVHKLLDTTMEQMDALMQQTMQQVTQGQRITPEVQKQIDKGRSEVMAMMKEMLDWNKLEPMYVRVYQKSFTQKEIDNLILMYQSPAGQLLLNKMPIVLQNTMGEMQQLMQPVMQRIRRMQQDVVAQLQAERAKEHG